MGKALVLLLAVLFTPVDRLYAQMHMGATVDAQHVMFGPEFIPRRTDLPKQLIVAGGATVELDATSAFDYIEVSGTLRVSRAHDTTLTFTHLIVMPGGVLDVGTQADPIPCGVSVLFVIRNVPIDTTIDPYQWGNGLVNFGRQTRVGCAKTSFLEALGSLPAGTNQIALATAPNGWRVGDELLIPDTAPPSLVQNGITVSRRESPVTIAAINNSTVVLSKPLDFEHNTIMAPNGIAVVRPRVGNLTRNIVVQSEDQFGTRGHTADIGDDASWDVEYNALLGLGRTLAKPVDNTVLPHIGTNQIGKYAAHHHHANSSVGSIDRGNVIRGNPNTTKWAISVHGTSDALVEDNIAIDFPGAGVVTEDGYEVRNVFRHNMAAYIGASNAADLNVFAGQVDVQNGCPGCEGSGFWFHGVMNTFDRNEGWNSVRGINLFNQQQVAGLYPSQPGGMPDTPNDNHTMQPIAMTSNVAVANTVSGYEFWAVRRFPNVGLVAANNWGIQADGVQSDGIDHFYQNPTIVCGNTTQIGILASKAYTGSFELQGGYVGGCNIGIMGGGGVNFENVTGATLQNATNMNLLPDHATFDHVTHLPLGNLPHTYLVMDNGDIRTLQPDLVWSGIGPLPRVGASRWAPQRGSQIIVHSWQGDGRDYQLFYKQQLGNLPAWYSAPAQHVWDPPIQGLTMQQSWDQLGMSYAGDVLAPSAAITLDGLAWGYARAGLTTTFSAPRAIVTFPTMREPALGPDGRDPSFTGYVRIWALNTGDPSAASDVTWYSVDGDPPVAWGSHGEVPDRLDDRSFNTPHADPGVHTVKMWRTGMDGVTQIASSVWTSQYFVSTPSTPPPTTVLVPNIVGSTQAIATSTLTAAGFVVGTVSSANSSSVAAGLVISQNPAGGSSAQAGTSVALVVSLGPAPTTLVPNLIGLAQADATSTLTAAGFVVGTVSTANNSTFAAGLVISQNPAGGASAQSGTSVALVVSLGPAGSPPPLPKIPNVVGSTQAAATSTLTAAGFVVGMVSTANSSTVGAGFVISQSPAGDTSAQAGTSVDLVVSLGPTTTQPPVTTFVPNVVGIAQAAATSTLTAAGFVVGTVSTANSSTVAAGFVISQSPSGGASAQAGTSVDLVVSLGPAVSPPPLAKIPNVVGSTPTAARSALMAAGFVLELVSAVNSSTVAAGFVISQNPAAGAAAPAGSGVDLVISLGPAPPPTTTPLPPTARRP